MLEIWDLPMQFFSFQSLGPPGPREKARGPQTTAPQSLVPAPHAMNSARKVLLGQSLHRPPSSLTSPQAEIKVPDQALGPGSHPLLWVTCE